MVSRAIQFPLYSAKVLASRPQCIPTGRPRGAKLAGVRYENALARALPDAEQGQWFEFVDRKGHGYCQTDLLVRDGLRLVVLEAKYTWTLEGHLQLDHLYRPVVEKAFGQKATGIVVCRRLVPQMPKSVIIESDLSSAIALAGVGHAVCLHWLGKTALQVRKAPVHTKPQPVQPAIG